MLQAAVWLVWKSGGDNKASVALPLAIFGVHALLGNQWNGMWSLLLLSAPCVQHSLAHDIVYCAPQVVFFGRRNMPGSLKWMGAFWISVASTALSFFTVHPLAGWLMLPTQARRVLMFCLHAL